MSLLVNHYPWVVCVGGVEYTQGDNTDPINDNGSNPPQSANPAPPAIPFPAKSPPPSAAPQEDDTPLKPDPEDDDGPGTNDDSYPGYVGGSGDPRVNPKPLPNPDGGGLAPNPDNATMTPKVGIKEDADSLDDHSAKPAVNDLNWYMGAVDQILSTIGLGLELVTDPETGEASWPLSFKRIETDFKRPNKVTDLNAEPKHRDNEDSDEVSQQDKPYETGTPI